MDIRDKKILVAGLALSGLATIKLLRKFNCDITLSEIKDIDLETVRLLQSYNVKIVKQSEELFDYGFDLVVKVPGISDYCPFIMGLKARNIPIITEIELAYNLSKKQHYCAITGTNGKTTTTTLTYLLLNKVFSKNALLGGNIGKPLCDLVLEEDLLNKEDKYIALEISNAQLINIKEFRPEISVIINLAPDHIDFMNGLENYYYSKTKIYENCKNNDVFLLNIDDELVDNYTKKFSINCKIKTFSLEKEADCCLKNGFICYENNEIIDISKIKVVGIHNIQNIMVAIMMAKHFNISNEDIQDVIYNFTGIEHRIEFVKDVEGVKYYNDSKGTNTDATITALKSFDKNVILLIGGYEKGLDMECIKPYLKCVKKIIGFGACGKRLINDLNFYDATYVEDIPKAIDLAHLIAKKGDIVLLSPTTSSFDQYTCYEERGEHFKKLVNSL